MSARRGRRRSAEEEEHGPDERWMASYMDMVTVLMCMFIVLFAMSSVDVNKFDQLRNSLATGFGVKNIGRIDTAKGTVVQPDKAVKNAQSFDLGQKAIVEVNYLKDLQKRLSDALSLQGLQGTVEFKIDQRGLTIRLVDGQTFFESNSTALKGVATRVLDTIAPVLAAAPNDISVEGHADARQPQAPYPTNWELSSGRAVQVLRRLVEAGRVMAEKIGAVGYGSSRPLSAGTTPEAMAQNRRVDIVVISNAPESVRALIPDVLNGSLTTTPAPSEISSYLLPAGVIGR